MPTPAEALPGRDERMPIASRHFVLDVSMEGPFEGLETAVFAMGCFWGAEQCFWEAPGVYTTAVGYAGGITRNPTYQEVCSGATGHTEVVRVVFDPERSDYSKMLAIFWQSHDPTQGMRQGNDVGTQYRSAIYCYSDEQLAAARSSCEHFQGQLANRGFGSITSEIEKAPEFYFAEDYHQQYMAKNPSGYCGLGGTGVEFSS